MTKHVSVTHTLHEDLDFIYSLFDQSVAYQVQKGAPVWRGYDKEALIRDVNNRHQYKITVGATIAMAFSVCYADPIIWRDREDGTSVYLHRIVVNPAFKGQKMFGHVMQWAQDHARTRNLRSIRMDTWDNNPPLIDYYLSFGFSFIERFVTPDHPDLPSHNRRLPIVLLEHALA